MKLILLTAFILKHGGNVQSGEQFGFPPQFHNPNGGVFASDSSVYLPPESHTPVPYFPMKKNQQNLPFPYLPPTGTKAPSIYPSPFPVILSSTLIPIFDDDDEKEHEEMNKIRISSPPPPRPQPKNNATENNPYAQTAMRREMRLPPKMPMPNYHNPIDRIDMRPAVRDFPLGFTTQSTINHSPKNMIISVSDTHRNDRGIDQIRAPSIPNPHYIPVPGFGLSSTTEPAIPILRLSNEMDLDGSFSYEALGADQTHYVQHSHMENMGTEKEEQVVEGSYSYVGDNGQTYTVHYIADSNGFRASGEHLPVAPPVPEIIQRAVQYNLAEEAKKPPHMRSWQDQSEGKEYESYDKKLHFTAPLPPPPPPRSLFTGRTPEAFSYNFGQGSNNENNIAAAPSSQISQTVKANSEITIDQTRGKSNGPAPQVTFLASQGAHVPSQNNPQQSISRMFSTEKSAMPQLVNYDAGIKEADQDNKGLWRWQYGLNSNNGNQSPDKNTISRSSGGGDDIMINFSDMTADQYTQMLKSQMEPTTASSQYSYNTNHNQQPSNQNQIGYVDSKVMNDYQNNNFNNYYPTNMENNQPTTTIQTSTAFSYSTTISPENTFKKENIALPYTNNLNHISPNTNTPNTNTPTHISPSTNTPSHISPKTLYFPHQTATEVYDNAENIYESKRIKPYSDTLAKSANKNVNAITNSNNDQKVSYNNIWSNAKDLQQHLQNEPKSVTQVPPFFNTMTIPRYSEVQEQKTEFKPILNHKEDIQIQTTTTTSTTTTAAPESTTEDLFKTNIFLKSFSTPKKTEVKHVNKIVEEPKKSTHNHKIIAETKADIVPKFVPYQPKPNNEVKSMKDKLSMDLMNYINMKNYFESNKMKPKNTFGYGNHENRKEIRYTPLQYDSGEEDDDDYDIPRSKNNLRDMNVQEQEELRGIIKNYKVLQRNNHARHSDMNSYQRGRETVPNSLKISQSAGLPPLGRAGPSMKTYLPPTYL